jgi:hypothetical protein
MRIALGEKEGGKGGVGNTLTQEKLNHSLVQTHAFTTFQP